MERERRSLGAARAGDEEVRVERDARRRRAAVHWRAAEAALDHRTIPEHRRRAAGNVPDPAPASSAAAILRGHRGDRLSTYPDGDVLAGGDAAQGDLQRRRISTWRRCPMATWLSRRCLPAAPVDQKAWIQYEFATPQTIRGTHPGGGRRRTRRQRSRRRQRPRAGSERRRAAVPHGRDHTSRRSGATHHLLCPGHGAVLPRHVPHRCAATGSRGWRRHVRRSARRRCCTHQAAGTQIAELVLHAGPRVNRFEEKAAFATAARTLRRHASRNGRRRHPQGRCHRPDRENAARRHAGLDSAGRPLDRAPHGLFADSASPIIPASPEATGLEVDKLNRDLRQSLLRELPGQVQRRRRRR